MSRRSTEENHDEAAILLAKKEEDALIARHKSSVPPFQRREAQAGVMVGAIAGAVLGAIAGPPGVIAGGAFGAAIGGLAGAGLDRVDALRDRRERELDDEIGITRGNMGAYPVFIPQSPYQDDMMEGLESTPFLPNGEEARGLVDSVPGDAPIVAKSLVETPIGEAAPVVEKTETNGVAAGSDASAETPSAPKEVVTSVDALLADIARSVSPGALSEGSMPKSAAVEKELGSLASALAVPPAPDSSPDEELFDGHWHDTMVDDLAARSSRRPSFRPSYRPSYRPSEGFLAADMTEKDPFPSIVPPPPKEA